MDDKTFGDVLDGFDFHKSKYLFNAIPIHLLGSMYERFLGNVIVATAKRATLEPKPEVRKAGGSLLHAPIRRRLHCLQHGR